MLIYESINYPLIKYIPSDIKNILDVGCGSGALGKYLKSQIPNLKVTGLTYSDKEAVLARQALDKVIIADLNNFDFQSLEKFDVIVCSHVLEHCFFPHQVLQNIKTAMNEDSQLFIALPNVLHWRQRLRFFTGGFRYTEGGIMDTTHYRFFDWYSANELITGNGFKIIDSRAVGNLPLPVLRKLLPEKVSVSVDHLACKLFPGLFGYQFLFICKLSK